MEEIPNTSGRDEESSALPENTTDHPTFKAYKRRWYVLAIFSLLSCLQCQVWNSFGPIDASIKFAYGWTDSTVAMMANWGTITFVIAIVPFCWALQAWGLRVVTVLVLGLISVGTALRVVSTDETTFLVMAHLGAIMNGIAGATVMSAPPALSAIWFPAEERTTATCISQVFNQLGNGVAFMLGPYLVPDGDLTHANVTDVRSNIRAYMGLDAGIAAAILVAAVIYFPKTPPTPPSASAHVPRTDFGPGLRDLARSKNVWFCAVGYAVSGGVTGTWQSVLTPNFKVLDVDDETSGKIGLVTCIVSCLVGLLVAYLTDHIRKHIKSTLLVLLGLATMSFIWLTLICTKSIPFSLWQLYVSTVAGISFAFALAPLFFEYTVELAYPAPEGLVGGFLTGLNNLIGMFFLFVFFIPDIGVVWMNYVLVAAMIISIPAVILTKESYSRLTVDLPGEDESQPEQPYAPLA